MKPKSDNLFHFTKTLDILMLILKGGIHPRYCLEDIEWAGLGNIKNLAFPMSCFCDIPLSRIGEHTNFYGSYGIGLSKDWAIQSKLAPVIYSTQAGSVQTLAKYLFKLGMKAEKPDKEMNYLAFRYSSMIKPITGRMVVKGEVVEKDFYQENEWRFVPPKESMIFEEDFDKEKDDSNREIEKYKLEISPKDIRYIFVKSDNDIPSLVDFIGTKMGDHTHNDLKILQTRIVSLDTLQADL